MNRYGAGRRANPARGRKYQRGIRNKREPSLAIGLRGSSSGPILVLTVNRPEALIAA